MFDLGIKDTEEQTLNPFLSFNDDKSKERKVSDSELELGGLLDDNGATRAAEEAHLAATDISLAVLGG